MATKVKTTIGTMRCLCCGESMPVKQAENGTLDLSCKNCDFSAYAKAGTEALRMALAKVTRRQAEPAPGKPEGGEIVKRVHITAPGKPRATIFG
jgi:hypothetical protein